MKSLTSAFVFSFLFFFSVLSDAQITWDQTKGPEGGAVSTICVDSIDHVFIATKAGGIYESADSGAHWIAHNEGLSTLFFRDLEAGSRGYAYALAQAPGIGIFRMKREDNTKWTLLDTTATFANVLAMAVTPVGDLFISTRYAGVLVSHDNGDHFSATNNGIDPKDLPIQFLSAADPSRLHAQSVTGVLYLSSDNGQHWSALAKNSASGAPHAMLPLANGSVVTGDKYGRVFLTTDGINWQLVLDSIQTRSGIGQPEAIYNFFYSQKNGHLFCRVVDGFLFRSSDMGMTWEKILDKVEGGEYFPAVVSRKGVIFGGVDYDGMIVSLDDGVDWEEINNGLIGTYIYSVHVGPNGTDLYSNSSERIYYSSDMGQRWETLNLEIHELLVTPSFSVDSAGVLYALDVNTLRVSSDNGKNWSKHLQPPDSTRALQAFKLVSSKSNTFAATSRGLFATSNHGTTWRSVTPTADSSSVNIVAIGMDGAVYAETDNGDLYRSTDDGAFWSNIARTDGEIATVLDGMTMFSIANGNTGERSTDGGHTWTEFKIDAARQDAGIFGLFGFSFDNKGQLFACTDSGIYTSKDLGNTWTMNSLGLQSTPVSNGPDTGRVLGAHDVCQDRFGNYYAASHGRGVFSSAALADVKRSPATDGALARCYPNPVSSTANLAFTLEAPANVHYEITDVAGHLVAFRSAIHMSAGEHSLEIQTIDLPNGNYLCSLIVGSERRSVWIGVIH